MEKNRDKRAAKTAGVNRPKAGSTTKPQIDSRFDDPLVLFRAIMAATGSGSERNEQRPFI